MWIHPSIHPSTNEWMDERMDGAPLKMDAHWAPLWENQEQTEQNLSHQTLAAWLHRRTYANNNAQYEWEK